MLEEHSEREREERNLQRQQNEAFMANLQAQTQMMHALVTRFMGFPVNNMQQTMACISPPLHRASAANQNNVARSTQRDPNNIA